MTLCRAGWQDTIFMVSGAIWASILDAFAGQRHQNERQRSEQKTCQKMIHFWTYLGLGCPSMSTPAKWGLCGRRPRARIVFLDLSICCWQSYIAGEQDIGTFRITASRSIIRLSRTLDRFARVGGYIYIYIYTYIQSLRAGRWARMWVVLEARTGWKCSKMLPKSIPKRSQEEPNDLEASPRSHFHAME